MLRYRTYYIVIWMTTIYDRYLYVIFINRTMTIVDRWELTTVAKKNATIGTLDAAAVGTRIVPALCLYNYIYKCSIPNISYRCLPYSPTGSEDFEGRWSIMTGHSYTYIIIDYYYIMILCTHIRETLPTRQEYQTKEHYNTSERHDDDDDELRRASEHCVWFPNNNVISYSGFNFIIYLYQY